MTASRQSPLSASTARLKRISAGRRNARKSESNTSATIGAATFQRFCCTRFKMDGPSNSQPEITNPSRDNSSAQGEIVAGVTGELVLGYTKPTARNSPRGRAVIFSRIQRLVSFVGQKT